MTLIWGFGANEQTAVFARKELTRRAIGFNAPQRPFGILDCRTPEVTDTCGVMRFERQGDQLVLVDVMALTEASSVPYDDALSSLPFDGDILSRMDTADTQVGYMDSELGGSGNSGAGAKVFWSGQLMQTPAPLHDLRNGYAETFSADVMLWLIDGHSRGTIIVARTSLASPR